MIKKLSSFTAYITALLLILTILPITATVTADNSGRTYLIPIEEEKSNNIQLESARSVNSMDFSDEFISGENTSAGSGGGMAGGGGAIGGGGTTVGGGGIGGEVSADYFMPTNKHSLYDNIWDMSIYYNNQYFQSAFNNQGTLDYETVDVSIKTLDGAVVMTNKNNSNLFRDPNGDEWVVNMECIKFKTYKTAPLTPGNYLADVTLNINYYDYDIDEKAVAKVNFPDMPIHFDYYQIINEIRVNNQLNESTETFTVDVLYTSDLPLDKDKVSLQLVDQNENIYAETVNCKYANYTAVTNDQTTKKVAVYTLNVTENITNGKAYYIKVNFENDLFILNA